MWFEGSFSIHEDYHLWMMERERDDKDLISIEEFIFPYNGKEDWAKGVDTLETIPGRVSDF